MSSILLFDSGLGGLSVYQHIHKALPNHSVRYLADNARFPYGELEPEDLVSGCVELIRTELARHPICLVVVACNSASTLVLEALRKCTDVPVVGVVPAIKPAAIMSKNKVIGLLATPGTVKRDYTAKLKQDFAAECELVAVGSSELVRLAERKINGESISRHQLEPIVAPFLEAPDVPDVVVLGCTHFPILQQELSATLGPKIRLLDSGAAIARRVSQLLQKEQVSNESPTSIFSFTGCHPAPTLSPFLSSLGFVERFEQLQY